MRKNNEFLSIVNSYIIDAPEPSNINYFWNLGSLLGVCLTIQLVSGIFLVMHYSSNINLAFISVQHIMTEVNYGWLVRYIHSNGAGFFFIFVYLHMARGMYYGSYKKPRVTLWTIGVIIFLLMIITAFMGKLTKSSPKLIKKQKHLHLFYNKKILTLNGRSTLNNPSLRIYSTKSTDLTDNNEIITEILGDIKLIKYWGNLEFVQQEIKTEVKNKSGIYIIINKISKNYYIGSALPNKLYNRFRSHLFNFSGNKIIQKSVKKYGINNFIYGILQYVNEDCVNYRIKIKELYQLETTYICLLAPKYNILTEAGSSLEYKHNEETIQKIKPLFTNERRELLKLLQKNSNSKRTEIVPFNGYPPHHGGGGLNRIEISSPKVFCTFNNINKMANFICCSSKTIKRALNKGFIYIPLIYIEHLTEENILKFNTIKELKPYFFEKPSLILKPSLVKVKITLGKEKKSLLNLS